MSKLKPLGDRIVVLPEETPNKIGGILIPDSLREKPYKGKVIEVGIRSVDIAPGDTVMYGKHCGTEVTFEKQKYIIMRAGDCFAVIE